MPMSAYKDSGSERESRIAYGPADLPVRELVAGARFEFLSMLESFSYHHVPVIVAILCETILEIC
jgi:hypothetical protein